MNNNIMKAKTVIEFLQYLKKQSFSYLFASFMAMLTFYVLIMFVVFPFIMVFFIIVQSITGEFPSYLPQTIIPYILWYSVAYWIGYTYYNLRKFEERRFMAEVSQFTIDQIVELATATDTNKRIKAAEIIPYHDYVEGILMKLLEDLAEDTDPKVAKHAQKSLIKSTNMIVGRKGETVNEALDIILAENVEGEYYNGEFTTKNTTGRVIVRNEGYLEFLNYYITFESTVTTLTPNFGTKTNLLTLAPRRETVTRYNIATKVIPPIILTTTTKEQGMEFTLSTKETVYLFELEIPEKVNVITTKGNIRNTNVGTVLIIDKIEQNKPITITLENKIEKEITLKYITKAQVSDIKITELLIEVPTHKYFYLIKGEDTQASRLLFQITNKSDFLIKIDKIKLSYTTDTETIIVFNKLGEQLAYDQKMLEAMSNTVIECKLDKHLTKYPKFNYEIQESVQHRFEFQTAYKLTYKL